MNTKDLVKYVSDKTLITEDDARVIVKVFLRGLTNGILDGNRITLRGFGTFYLQDRKARTALDPRNQEQIQVPAKKVVKFIPSIKLKINPV